MFHQELRVRYERDFNGNITTYEYDASSNLTKTVYHTETNPSSINAETDTCPYNHAAYNSNNQRTHYTDENGHVTDFSYVGPNLHTVTTHPKTGVSNTTTYYYAENTGWLASVKDANGHVTRYSYNACGEKYAESYYLNENDDLPQATYTYEYNNAGLVEAIIDEENFRTEFAYDDNGNQIRATDPIGVMAVNPAGHSIVTDYDDNNNIHSKIDTRGNETTYEYDHRDRMVENRIKMSSDADEDLVTSYTYTPNGDILTSTDPEGYVTEFHYDLYLKKPDIITAKGDPSTTADDRITQYQYDDMGNIKKIIYPNGSEESFTYDNRNRQKTQTSQLGLLTTFEYDDVGNVSSIVNSAGQEYSYTYYHDNRTETATDPEGGVSTYSYDAVGNVEEIQDPTAAVISYTYDYRNRKKTETNGENETTTYEYNKRGDIKEIEDAEGNITKMTYYPNRTLESQKRITNKNNNAGYTTTFTYDGNENLLTTTDPLSHTTTYEYDSNNRLKTVYAPFKANDFAVTAYEYDKNGNNIKITDAEDYVTEFEYNEFNELKTTIKDVLLDSNAFSQTQGFQQSNSLQSQWQNPFSSSSNVATSTNSSSSTSSFNQPFGNSTNQQSNINSLMGSSSQTGQAITINYTYDKLGRLHTQSDSVGHLTTFVYNYLTNGGYTQAQTDKISSSENRSLLNTYDKLGRLSTAVGYDGETYSYQYDKLDRTKLITDPDSNTTEYDYDGNGNLTEQKNVNGGIYSFEYDKANRRVKDTNPLGTVTKYEYDDVGNLTKKIEDYGIGASFKNLTTQTQYDVLYRPVVVKNPEEYATPNSQGTLYSYDALNRVESETSSLGYVKEYEYDYAGNLITYQIQGEQNSIFTNQYEYDKLNNNIKTTSPRGAETVIEYNGLSLPIFVTDNDGYVTAYDYRDDGQLSAKAQPNGGVYTYDYDLVDRLIYSETPEGQSVTYAYDANGDLESETDQSNRSTVYEYDAMHRIHSATNAKGNTSTFDYDSFGRLHASATPRGGETTYEYNLLDQPITVQNPAGLISTYDYDHLSNVKSLVQDNASGYTNVAAQTTTYGYDKLQNTNSVINALNQESSLQYDLQSRLTHQTDTAGNTSTYTYDSRNNLITSTNRNGFTTTYSYDEDSNLSSLTDPENRQTTYYYNLMNRLETATQHNDSQNADVTFAFEYDSMGNLHQTTDGKGGETIYDYDLENRITSVQNPLAQTFEYQYDADGNLSYVINPDQTSVHYAYNEINQLSEKDASDSTVNAMYGYDADGNKVAMHDVTNTATGATEYSYDLAGRITSSITQNGGTIGYEYDVFGNIIKLTYPDSSFVTYNYDALNRMKSITGRDGEVTYYHYDTAGNLDFVIRPNSTFSSIEHDNEGNITKLSNVNAITGKVISDFTYERDDSGYITQEIARQNGISITSVYQYDSRGQLKQVQTQKFDKNGTYSYRDYTCIYTYDANGNKVEELCYYTSNGPNSPDRHVINTYNAANQLTEQENSKYSPSTYIYYSYNTNGNLASTSTTYGGTDYTYTYDTENRLKAVKDAGTLLLAALYDGNGDRVFTLTGKFDSGYSHDNGQDGRWSEESIPSQYLVSDWVYTGENPPEIEEPTDPPEPPDPDIEFEITDISYDDGVITAQTQGETGVVTYWFYATHNGAVTFNSGGWSMLNYCEYTASTGQTIRVYAQDGTGKRISSSYVVNFTESSDADTDNSPVLSYNSARVDDVLFISNGVNTPQKREQYYLTGFVNDINRQYTETLMEFGGTGKLTNAYDYGVQRNAVSTVTGNDNGHVRNTYYYNYDGRGSVSMLTGSNGAVGVAYRYGANGETTIGQAHTNSADFIVQPYRYNAERIDTIGGGENVVPAFQYLRARYLNLYTNTFISQDSYLGQSSLPLTLNRYLYANGNAVNYYDPSGHSIQDLLNKGKQLVGKGITAATNTLLKAKKSATGNYMTDGTGGYLKGMSIEAKAKQLAQMCTDYEFALLAQNVYQTDLKKDDAVGHGWIVDHIETNGSSMKVGVYKRLKADGTYEYAVVNKGTDASNMTDWFNNATAPFGYSPDMNDSRKYAKDFVNSHQGSDVTFVGHSKGGAEAYSNAYATGKNAVVFDPMTPNLANNGLNKNTYTGTTRAYVAEGEALDVLVRNPNSLVNTTERTLVGALFGTVLGKTLGNVLGNEVVDQVQGTPPGEVNYLTGDKSKNILDNHDMNVVLAGFESVFKNISKN